MIFVTSEHLRPAAESCLWLDKSADEYSPELEFIAHGTLGKSILKYSQRLGASARDNSGCLEFVTIIHLPAVILPHARATLAAVM
jgi:hypothetical protein